MAAGDGEAWSVRGAWWLGVATACLVAGTAPAGATIDNFKSFKQAYPSKDAKAVSCKICHQHPLGRKDDLNAYAAALQRLKAPDSAKRLTIEDYRAVETQDSDGDGVSNIEELNVGTAPGDPTSVPPAAPGAPTTKPAAAATEAVGDGATPPAQDAEAASTSGGRAAPASSPDAVPDDARPSSRASQALASLDRLVMSSAWADSSDATSNASAGVAEYVGIETCAACHAKEFQEFQHSTHARINIPAGSGAQGCEMCHGPGSLHAQAGGVGHIINPRKDPSACFACHLDKKAEFRLPYHHPLLEGKMGCTDCHSPHGEDVRPWSATTLKDINEACFRCHKEQRGPFVWEHEALREGCTTCHKVHGSIHEKMLLARDSNLCLRCHTQVGFPTIGKSSHAGRLPQGTCFSAGCHTAVHGSNFDDHLRY